MNRLTTRHYDGTGSTVTVGDRTCSCDATARLAAYEDTGLEPEDIDALRKREQGLAELLVKVSCGCAVSYTRLTKLAQAEKDGRLVVLLCKVGEKVWWVHNRKITPCRVYRIQFNRRGLMIALRSDVSHGVFSIDQVGKTIFLTRKEAEAELKKREEAT